MTVSMRVMSADDGYKYLLRTVAAGDGDRSLSTPLTRYYAEKGTPETGGKPRFSGPGRGSQTPYEGAPVESAETGCPAPAHAPVRALSAGSRRGRGGRRHVDRRP